MLEIKRVSFLCDSYIKGKCHWTSGEIEIANSRAEISEARPLSKTDYRQGLLWSVIVLDSVLVILLKDKRYFKKTLKIY
jgi:hypothetical protein